MRKISDTIARLAASRASQTEFGLNSGAPDRLLDLAGFGSNPGGLRARYHLPANLPDEAPLVVVLHGCTQTAAAYDLGSGWSQLADQAGFAVLFPQQQRVNNPNLCFNWFLPEDIERGSGEALSIHQMIEAMVTANGLDRKRIFITGLSAGGAMTSVMLATYPEVFAGGAIIAGLPYGSAKTVPEAFDRMRGHGGPSLRELNRLLRRASSHERKWPSISIWHGDADTTVAPSNAEAIVAQWQGVHGLSGTAAQSTVSGRRSKRVWRNASHDPVLELNLISGMGHGTPLAGDGLGNPGPYMLDVGVSSTREIAASWGIAKSVNDGSSMARSAPEPEAFLRPSGSRTTNAAQSSILDLAPRQQTVDSSGPRKIIEDALRKAGLMR